LLEKLALKRDRGCLLSIPAKMPERPAIVLVTIRGAPAGIVGYQVSVSRRDADGSVDRLGTIHRGGVAHPIPLPALWLQCLNVLDRPGAASANKECRVGTLVKYWPIGEWNGEPWWNIGDDAVRYVVPTLGLPVRT
jgi:hypothetical protein